MRTMPRVADYIPQSVIDSPGYGLFIATYASSRFVEPDTTERPGLAPVAPSRAEASARAAVYVALGLATVWLVVALIWCVPLFINP